MDTARGLGTCANRIRNMFPLPDRIRRRGFKGAILISPHAFRNSSRSLAMLAAIFRASSLLGSWSLIAALALPRNRHAAVWPGVYLSIALVGRANSALPMSISFLLIIKHCMVTKNLRLFGSTQQRSCVGRVC